MLSSIFKMCLHTLRSMSSACSARAGFRFAGFGSITARPTEDKRLNVLRGRIVAINQTLSSSIGIGELGTFKAHCVAYYVQQLAVWRHTPAWGIVQKDLGFLP